MTESTEGLTDREIGAILVRLDQIQETLTSLNRMVANHESAINRMRGALWVAGAGMPFLLFAMTFIVRRLWP